MRYVYGIGDSDYFSSQLSLCPLGGFLTVPNGPSSLACSLSPVVLAGHLRDECDIDDGAYFSSQLSLFTRRDF